MTQDLRQVHQRGHGRSQAVDDLLGVVLLSEKKSVDQGLNPVTQGIKDQDEEQGKKYRKGPGLGKLVLTQEKIETQADQSIGADEDHGHNGVAQGPLDQRVGIEEIVFDNGVGNGCRKKNDEEGKEIPGKVYFH